MTQMPTQVQEAVETWVSYGNYSAFLDYSMGHTGHKPKDDSMIGLHKHLCSMEYMSDRLGTDKYGNDERFDFNYKLLTELEKRIAEGWIISQIRDAEHLNTLLKISWKDKVALYRRMKRKR